MRIAQPPLPDPLGSEAPSTDFDSDHISTHDIDAAQRSSWQNGAYRPLDSRKGRRRDIHRIIIPHSSRYPHSRGEDSLMVRLRLFGSGTSTTVGSGTWATVLGLRGRPWGWRRRRALWSGRGGSGVPGRPCRRRRAAPSRPRCDQPVAADGFDELTGEETAHVIAEPAQADPARLVDPAGHAPQPGHTRWTPPVTSFCHNSIGRDRSHRL